MDKGYQPLVSRSVSIKFNLGSSANSERTAPTTLLAQILTIKVKLLITRA